MMKTILDKEHLDELVSMLGPKELKGIVDTFSSHSLELIEKAKVACQHKNQTEATVLVHSLKGCCRNIGATSLADQCAEIEKLAAVNNLDAVSARLPLVLQDLSTTVSDIRVYAKLSAC